MVSKITLSPGRGKASKVSNHRRKPGKRGECRGWTAGAARRNADFLGSIVPHELDGHGVACSLTVRIAPGTAKEWHEIREALLQRLRRMGLIRFHWVTEWQLRSRHGGGPVPHMHGIFYFPHRAEKMAEWVIHHWLEVSQSFGSERWAQDAKGVPKLSGWLQYLTKHGSRSVSNVQRMRGTMPEEWETAGRLWGKGGEWPTRSQAVIADDRVFYAYRRLLRKHAEAEARARLLNARRWRNGRQERQALRSLSISRQCLKWPRAPRKGEQPQDLTIAQVAHQSRCKALSGFLGDVDVDRWLHTLPAEWWRYDEGEEGAEAPPDPLSSRRAVGAGGAGHE